MEQDKRAAATLRLLKIMDELRAKCPWDRKQTFETLRGNTIEETYELADAILDRNMEGIREELEKAPLSHAGGAENNTPDQPVRQDKIDKKTNKTNEKKARP